MRHINVLTTFSFMHQQRHWLNSRWIFIFKRTCCFNFFFFDLLHQYKTVKTIERNLKIQNKNFICSCNSNTDPADEKVFRVPALRTGFNFYTSRTDKVPSIGLGCVSNIMQKQVDIFLCSLCSTWDCGCLSSLDGKHNYSKSKCVVNSPFVYYAPKAFGGLTNPSKTFLLSVHSTVQKELFSFYYC